MIKRQYHSLDYRHTTPLQRAACALFFVAAMAIVPLRSWADSDDPRRFIPDTLVSSTIPASGDLNPYGVAFVPPGFPPKGALKPGDILVSNFNNFNNLQGTGTTIIKLTPSSGLAAPDNQATVFFQGSAPGLTLALGVLKRGIVVVGSVSTTDGKFDTIKGGPLTFIDKNGKFITQLDSSSISGLNGPWGLAVSDDLSSAKLFVSNVLKGTVIRIDLSLPGGTTIKVTGVTQVADGYLHAENDAALVVGPTGLFYDKAADVLYVASTADNKIYKKAHAGTTTGSSGKGTIVFTDSHLRGPLALALAPNGHLLTSNGDALKESADPAQPSEIVEFTKTGKFVGQFNVHQNEGGAFGVATSRSETVIAGQEVDIDRLAVVNDNANDVAVTTFIFP